MDLVSTGKEVYQKMAKFWGKLFLINFAMGVVTGIVQEFHFGMNWAEYSRFMGDILVPSPALEGINGIFLGIYIYGRLDLLVGVAYLIKRMLLSQH